MDSSMECSSGAEKPSMPNKDFFLFRESFWHLIELPAFASICWYVNLVKRASAVSFTQPRLREKNLPMGSP